MPTIRGTEEGSKKRYAGLVRAADGSERMVFKGLETVRTDWSPLAQRFQQELYRLVFAGQPYEDYVRDYVKRTLAGELMSWRGLSQALAPTPRRLPAQRAATRTRRAPGRRAQSELGRLCNISAAAGSAI